MSKNTKTHPHNKYVVSTQLDEEEYHYFTEIRRGYKINTTDALKALVDQAICRYLRALGERRQDAASEALFDDHAVEKREIFNEIIREEKEKAAHS